MYWDQEPDDGDDDCDDRAMENVLFLSVANRNDVDNNNDDDNNDDDNINDDNNNDDDVASLFISKKAPKKFCYKIVGRENEAHHCRRSHRRRPQLQCDQIWLNFSTLAKFKKSLGNFCCGLISIWQASVPTLAICYATGQILIVVNGKRLQNNLAVWSHCQQAIPSSCFNASLSQSLHVSNTILLTLSTYGLPHMPQT